MARGHTAHATRNEAIEESERMMMNVYADFAENFMAIPVVKGSKETERFAGAEETYCIEALMQDGKRFQANVTFLAELCKAFDVKFANAEGKQNMFGELHGVFRRV
jgi:prolyl-tRNA synthetase